MPLGVSAFTTPEDSLEHLLSSSSGKQRADILNQLSEVYKVRVPAKALSYGQEALLLATQSNYQFGIATALNNIGEYYLNNGNNDQAFQHFEKALTIGKSIDNKQIIAVSLAKVGVVYYFLGKYDKALLYAQHALRLLQELDQKKEWAENLNIISYIYSAKGNTQKALDYSIQALRLREKMQDNNEIAKSLNSIGDFYLKQNNLAKALQNYNQSLKISRTIDNKRGIAFSLANIGNVYSRQGEYKQAFLYYKSALKLNRQLGNQYQVAVLLSNLGAAYMDLKKYEQAREQYQEALALFDKLKNQQQCATVLNKIGFTYSQQQQYSQALGYHQKALEIAIGQPNPSKPILQETYKAIADTYLAMNQAQTFMKYYQQYNELKLEQERQENKNKIAEMQAQFEEEENQKKLEQINEQRKQQATQLNRQRTIANFLIACIILSVGFSVVLFSFYRLKQRSNKRLKEQNTIISKQFEDLNYANSQLNTLNEKLLVSEAELRKSNETKDKFFSIIAHDLRSPLATFTAFLSVLSGKNHAFTTEQITEVAIGTEKSLRNLSTLLNNLLQWSQSQMGHLHYDPEAVWVYDSVQQTANLLQDEVENKDICITITVNHDLFAFADRNMFSFVIRNLISNAIKFTPKYGTIFIDCVVQSGNQLLLTVSDTGVGIPPENLDKLFKPNSNFTTPGTFNERGTGLGLLLCKEFVEKNGGSIWVESEVGEGSHFKFTVPRYLS